MLHRNHGNGNIYARGLKRSASPDYSLMDLQKTKVAKIELQKNGGNKENLIKRTQSEMVLTKDSSVAIVNKSDSDDIPCYQSHPLWSNMMIKTFDKTYKYHLNVLDSHPPITTKMRSVLFDWLIEVSEVYQLHRETYHLSIAYVDQYLCNTSSLLKNKFQLLGITSLFVAAKIEEIYPPRLSDFAYVTDNTCSEEDILDMEIDLMNTLNWYINPITCISWLLIYLQVDYEMNYVLNKSHSSRKKQRLSFSNSEILRSSKLTNAHRSKDFLQIFPLAVRLLDLCSLDIECSQYSKHVLAASSILLYKSHWPIQAIIGLNNNEISKCQQWMKPFYEVLSGSLSYQSVRSSSSVPDSETYSIQIHNISMDLLANVYEKRAKVVSSLMNNRPFRDLVNHLSSSSIILGPQKNEDEQQQINDITVTV
ncbi:unnamed protein product [Rotaria magnacalcarata]|uniref:Uncharacterized protein n=1 Tax=Rotaria magnacalcarata TaxID=392030 RepID=A0A816SKZ6_9BILA|nr:unnamed protein product [Rotaria magnacalcarata]CAF3923874.1 unnamed protein product [Rotaria magnacalcarata]